MFEGKGQPLSETGLARSANRLKIGLSALWAVMTVETKGCGFFSDRRPQILFERHIFHRETRGKFDAVAPDLSRPAAGGYGIAGPFQYDRLARAIALDRIAALRSTSWGLGQIMGFNAPNAGFDDVETMVRAMCESEDAQLQGMTAFIEKNGLHRCLQKEDWADFAYHYNGSDFQKNRYDTKLRIASARFKVGPLPSLQVRAAQLYLTYLGYAAGGVDGWFGSKTQNALIKFQNDKALTPTGMLDDETAAALQKSAMG